ncbi:MAG TPA: M48 family metallopeptidase [Geobacteraceae bacterium]
MDRAGPGSKIKGLVWLAVALCVGGGAALGVPFAARHVPWSVEKRLAVLQNGLPQIRVCDEGAHKDAAALFEKVVRRVYPVYPSDREFPVRIKVIRGTTVNAFAFLGGEIFVYEGLLKETESAEELAGILAHEIEHVKRRHIMQGVFVRLMTAGAVKFIFSGTGAMDPKLAGMLLHMRFSREQEREADEGALRRLRDGRVDVAGFQHFFERAESSAALPTILSDHPANDARAQLVARFRGAPAEPIMSKSEWAVVKTMCR